MSRFILFILMVCSLVSECYTFEAVRLSNPENEIWQSITDNNGEPSTTVGGVNVITGSYCDATIDLVIPGAHPLVIKRNYSSSDAIGVKGNVGTLCHSWNLNHLTKVEFTITPDVSFATLKEEGSNILYTSQSVYNRSSYNFQMSPKLLELGVTNTSFGAISSRTNLRNSYIHCGDNALP